MNFKANSWYTDEKNTAGTIFYIAGRTEKDETILVKVIGFKPHAYLQLPTHTKSGKLIEWTDKLAENVFLEIREHYRNSDKRLGREALPLEKCCYMMKKSTVGSEKTNLLYIMFNSSIFAKKFSYYLAKFDYANNSGVHIKCLNGFLKGIKLHEHQIEPLLKYTTMQKLPLCGWLTINNPPPQKDHDFSTCDLSYVVSWQNIVECLSPPVNPPKPTVFSFDLECYSVNHNSKNPDPTNPGNEIFIINIYHGKKDGALRHTCLSLKNPKPIKDVEIRPFKNEKELLLGFSKYIVDIDPDYFVGYNILKFDWDYIIVRLQRFYPDVLGRFLSFSKLSSGAFVQEVKWKSSAYNEQIFRYPECLRNNLDVMIDIERNHKLPTYKLSFVANKFLGEDKEDVTPRQLFMIYKFTCDTYDIIQNPNLSEENFIEIKRLCDTILDSRRLGGQSAQYKKNVMNASIDTIISIVRDGITMLCSYCVQDTVLPIRLETKFSYIISNEQMSKIMRVPYSWVNTRGQQIKLLAQAYMLVFYDGFFIPAKAKDGDDVAEKYQGAMVVEAIPGHYENVASEDFASLYPSIMLLMNACVSTYRPLLEGENPSDFEETHNIVSFSSHIGCEHDPDEKRKRKTKKENVLCGSYVYMFKKVSRYVENGVMCRKKQGILPKLVQNLLDERRAVKKVMGRHDATIKMHNGDATDGDISFFKKIGIEIIKPGQLFPEEYEKVVANYITSNCTQLALKVSANSVYGGSGSNFSMFYCMPVASSITAIGRMLIGETSKKILAHYHKDTQYPAKVVYGDTDSSLVCFEGADTVTTFKLGAEASKVATHYLKAKHLKIPENYSVDGTPIQKITLKDAAGFDEETQQIVLAYIDNPLNLEFENVYKEFLLLTKKRYLAYVANAEGKIIDTVNKGVVMARRDNSEFLRNTYESIKDAILTRKSDPEIMELIYSKLRDLFTRRIPDSQFVIYMGVKSIIDYAKKTKLKGSVVFLDEKEKQITPYGPLDDRLIYPSLVQVRLALKMMRRGVDVPPNTRLEYVYINNVNAVSLYEKAEDYSYYKENKRIYGLSIDKLHYIEKQLVKPIAELLMVKFARRAVVYEKLQDKFQRLLSSPQLNALKTLRLARTKIINHTTRHGDEDCIVGWNALQSTIKRVDLQRFICCLKENNQQSKKKFSGNYRFVGLRAKAKFIVESWKNGEPNDFQSTVPIENELVMCAKIFTSRAVLDDMCARLQTKKRAIYDKPTNRIMRGSEIILVRGYGEYPEGTEGVVTKVNTTPEKITTYDIIVSSNDGDFLVEGVNKSAIYMKYYKGEKIMTEIFKSRVAYSNVVSELKELFNPVVIVDV